MAMLLVRRKLKLPCFLVRGAHRFSSSTTQNPSPNSSFISGYLMKSLGFSSDKVIKASKYLNHIQSPSNPDSVVHFFKQNGLNDAGIATLVSKYPRILLADVRYTLEPKIRELREVGFSDSEIVQFIAIPRFLLTGDLQPKIAMFLRLFRNTEEFFRATKRNPQIIIGSLEKTIMPSISLLREYGISDDNIAKHLPFFRSFNPKAIFETAKLAEELGFSRSSGMFRYALHNLLFIGRTQFDAKFKFFKGLGWSEAEVRSAIRKQPSLLALSEKRIHKTMNFLTKESECEPSYIACRPRLIMFSLEKRLVPRFRVLMALKKEGLLQKQKNLDAAFGFTENKFIEKYVQPYEAKVPGLLEAYLAARSGKVPTP